MSATQLPLRYDLHWEGDQRFSGRTGGVALTLDGDGAAGPSPMQAVAFGLAACMSIDVTSILQKGRHPLRGLDAQLSAWRTDVPPRRFERFALHFVVSGEVPGPAIERAIALSRDRYCSVWHSLRPDIELAVTYDVAE